MRGYMTISDEDKDSILQQHSTFYNGYATGNVPSDPQPLRQDKGHSDVNGITVNNKGVVSQYKNHLVNESEVKEYYTDDMDVSDVESAYDFESGGPEQFDGGVDFPPEFGDELSDYDYSESSYDDDIDSLSRMFDGLHDYEDESSAYEFESDGPMDDELYEEEVVEKETCEQCGSEMREGECVECGSMYEEIDEDLKESFTQEKQRISEMFDRFKKFN